MIRCGGLRCEKGKQQQKNGTANNTIRQHRGSECWGPICGMKRRAWYAVDRVGRNMPCEFAEIGCHPPCQGPHGVGRRVNWQAGIGSNHGESGTRRTRPRTAWFSRRAWAESASLSGSTVRAGGARVPRRSHSPIAAIAWRRLGPSRFSDE